MKLRKKHISLIVYCLFLAIAFLSTKRKNHKIIAYMILRIKLLSTYILYKSQEFDDYSTA